MFIDYNCIDAMEIKEGDEIKCVESTCEDRVGKKFIATRRLVGRKVREENGLMPILALQHFASYGDKFQLINKEER